MGSASNGISVRPVKGRRELKTFIRFPWQIYRNDPNWVPPLLIEEKKRLNPSKNPFFEHGEAQYFLAYRDGKPVGRISAHIDQLHNERHQEKTGFFGFFETIEDQTVANALLECAGQWLVGRGMTQMRGPFSFSINEESGLLIDGFEHSPFMMTGHNPPYYAESLETWGLNKIKDLYCWRLDPQGPISESALQIADAVRQHPGLVVRTVDPENTERDIRIIIDVFNAAWQHNWSFVPLTDTEVRKVVAEFKLILEPGIALIAEVDGKPAAIALSIPDINGAIRDLNGRLFPTGLFKLLYRIKWRGIRNLRMMLLGVKKEYRGGVLGGLSVLLNTEMHRNAQALGFGPSELSWTLADNEKVNMGIQLMGGEHYKTYRIYQKELTARG